MNSIDDFVVWLFNTYAIRAVWQISAVFFLLSGTGWCIKAIYQKVKELKKEEKDVTKFLTPLLTAILVFTLLIGITVRLCICKDDISIHCINVDGNNQIPAIQYNTNRSIYRCNTNSEIQILSFNPDRFPVRSGSILSVAFMWEIAGKKSQVEIADMLSHAAQIQVPFLKVNEEARLWVNILTAVDTDEESIIHRLLGIKRQYASSGWRFYDFRYDY